MTHRPTATRDRDRTLIARTKPNCWICGQPINYDLKWPHPQCFVVDHKVPLALGGKDHISNKAAAHNHCNSTKRAKRVSPTIRRSGTLN